MDRHDTLGSRHDRRAAFRGRVLEDDEDSALQSIVAEAAAAMQTPISLVSLVLDHCQVFRAHHGLPDDLRTLKATDRNVSFCQFVVRDDQLFEVTNAVEDTRLPKELVKKYGIRAYLGAPVHVADETVGSLCVIDSVERDFSSEERQQLLDLAERASLRLAELAGEPELSLVERATLPAFSEIRNVLQILQLNTSAARVVRADLAPLARYHELSAEDQEKAPIQDLVRHAKDAAQELDEILGDVESGSDRLISALTALEAVTGPASEGPSLGQLLDQSRELALHHLKLLGDFEWPEVERDALLASSDRDCIAALAALLSQLGRWANRHRGTKVAPSIQVGSSFAVVDFQLDSDGAYEIPDIVEALSGLVERTPGVAMECNDDRVGLRFLTRN